MSVAIHCLVLSVSVRNRRSAQGDRLSAITMALQYESDEEGILSGTSLPQYHPLGNDYDALYNELLYGLLQRHACVILPVFPRVRSL